METYDVRLISASYVSEGEDNVIVELFGKTRDKKSITILSYGAKPYFFIVEPKPGVDEVLKKDPGVVSVDYDKLFYKAKERDVLRVTIKHPWEVPEYRNRWKRDFDILAADIPFHHRYLYDNDIGACISVTGDVVENDTYCTDIVLKMDSLKNIESFDPGLKVLSFDIENSIANETIYIIGCAVGEDGKITETKVLEGNEKEIITGFAKYIESVDPDIISGYNIDNYDIRHIIKRAKVNKVDGELKWGRDRGLPKEISDKFWRLKGRLVIDVWWAVKKELRPKQETLNAVSMLILGESKMDVDPKKMDSEWENNPAKVKEYCIQDAKLSLKILAAIGTIRRGMDLATVSLLPLDDVLNSGSSQLIDSILIRRADREKVGVPLTGKFTRTDQIEGGYVHTMAPGLYHWVCVLDFKSMYPSLIISKNICFTTLSDVGEIESPTGARFLSKEKKVGLLPRILEELMTERDRIKSEMKKTTNEKERKYLNGLQEAVKVLMNSFYGVFASAFYRFTDKKIGSSITGFARARVTGIIKELTDEKIPVIYSDTDSVFIQSTVNDLEKSAEFGKNIAARYSIEGGQLEFEKIMEPLFSHGKKKRYVGRVVWPKKDDELLVRGYEIRRSDSFDIQSRLLMELFEKILDEDSSGAIAIVRKTVKDVLSGNVDAKDLVISRTCRGPDSYENPDRMANVQAARKLVELGYEFIPGMKVSWIVTDSKKTPQAVEPFISGVEFKGKPDYKYYAERLAQMASRITEVFGWSEKALMTGNQQSSLFDEAFETTPIKKPEEKPKETKAAPKKTNLSDFF